VGLSSQAPAFAEVERGDLRLLLSGSQIVLDDPSGNAIELFQPR